MSDWQAFTEVLETYKITARQGINKYKTRLFFNSNTYRTAKGQILSIVGVSQCKDQDKYLGLPMIVDRNWYCTFERLKDKV